MVTWSRAGLWGDRGEDATSNYSDRGMNAALEVKIPPCGRRVVDCSKCSDVVCSIKYGARERNRPAWRSLAHLCCRCCRLTTARSQGQEYFRSPTDRRDAERHLGCQLQSAEGRVRRLSQRRDLHPGGTNCPYFASSRCALAEGIDAQSSGCCEIQRQRASSRAARSALRLSMNSRPPRPCQAG